MPLVDLKTNLKSIKYGMDQRGGGWSGQPFVQFPIEGDSTVSSLLSAYYKQNRTGLDWPIRGGSTLDLTAYSPTTAGEIDKVRISKFMQSAPRGKAFLDKQIGLQLSNPKSETGTSLYGLAGQNVLLSGLGVIENTRVYNNGVNTLTQVQLAGTGVHIPRIGSFAINPTAMYYSDIVGKQNTQNDSSENRLLTLYGTKMLVGSYDSKSSRFNTRGATATATYAATLNIQRLGIASNKNMLFSYLGGPESTYGIGATQIRRYEDTSKAYMKTRSGMSYDELMNQKIIGAKSSRGATVSRRDDQSMRDLASDRFRSAEGEISFEMAKSEAKNDVLNNNIDYKFYTYSPSGSSVSKVIDKLNVKEETNLRNIDPWSSAEKDLIKFGFECISNDNPDSFLFLQFRAYLTSGITDNHQGNWQSFKYMGRGEDFHTYQGFSRAINFGFRIAAGSEAEMEPLYKKLNALVSQVYPDYSPSTRFMRAPIVRLTIGNYIYRMSGVLDSVNITVANDASWEINEDNQLPMYLDVSVSFMPIMNELPERFGSNLINNPKLQSVFSYSPMTIWNEKPYEFDMTKTNDVSMASLQGKTPGVSLP